MPYTPAMIPMIIPDYSFIKGKVFLAQGAGDVNNTATITKEFDRSERDGKINHDGDRHADNKAEKLERLSQPTGDVDVDAARSTFVEKLQELKAALESEDSEKASELRDELKNLRSELGNIRSFGRQSKPYFLFLFF